MRGARYFEACESALGRSNSVLVKVHTGRVLRDLRDAVSPLALSDGEVLL